jgi:hypothetical protein
MNNGVAYMRVLLTPEEVTARLHELACTWDEFERLEEDHVDRRRAMKREREALMRRLSLLADAVRTGVEDRPVPAELFDEGRGRAVP